jgi:hypothetical protein
LRGCTVFNYGFAIVFHVCGLKIVNISFEALAKCCAMQAGVRFHGNWRFPILSPFESRTGCSAEHTQHVTSRVPHLTELSWCRAKELVSICQSAMRFICAPRQSDKQTNGQKKTANVVAALYNFGPGVIFNA